MEETAYANLLEHKSDDAFIKWTCPKGHEQKDYTPVEHEAYCVACGLWYSWAEIEKHGPLMAAEWTL